MNLFRTPGLDVDILVHVITSYDPSVNIPQMNRYVSADPNVISAQLDVMQYIGVAGAVVLTKGSGFSWEATKKLAYTLNARRMPFAIMLDKWVAKISSSVSPNDNVINFVNSKEFQELVSLESYLHDETQTPVPVVYEFDLGPVGGADISVVNSKIYNCQLGSKHTAFGWLENTAETTLSTLKNDYAKNPTILPCAAVEFNDCDTWPNATAAAMKAVGPEFAGSVWDHTKVHREIRSQAGNFYFDMLALVPKTAKRLQIVTWNDYRERTNIEQVAAVLAGIRIGK